MDTGGEYLSGSDEGVAGRKRKSRQNLKCLSSEEDCGISFQEVMHDYEYIPAKNCSRTSGYHQKGPDYDRKKVSDPILDDEACHGSNSPVIRHGLGKGPLIPKRSPIKKHGMGKGFMSQKAPSRRKHGIGKDLMTLMANRNVPPSTGKGLMTMMAMRPERHGIGKGFMTFSKGKNHCLIADPCGADCGNSSFTKRKQLQRESVVRKLSRKEMGMKTATRNKGLKCQKVDKKKLPCKEKCELASDFIKVIGNLEQFSMLVDDEELELRELQAGPKMLTCSAHFPSGGFHGCSLCKGLLANFPPSFVMMKPPLPMQPWASSPQLATKLFKAFHFLCTYAITIGIHSFTLDDFVAALNDQNSLLLAQVHLALLRLLLFDIEKELKRGFYLRAVKNCKYLNLLHSLDHSSHVLEFWKKSLNHLTWCEIVRQVFIKAGFGSKLGVDHKADCGKEVSLMDKYGLSPNTLKGELFCILLNKGKSGMGVSDLARSPSIVQLNLTNTADDLENLISSTLSGDITLFEKIYSSGYRYRVHAVERETMGYFSESEDFGSGDDVSEVTGGNDANDIEHESEGSTPSKIAASDSNFSMSLAYNEIDESYTGEAWLLGLAEGEFSDLSMEDKLNCLASLIDLLSAGSSIIIEDPLTSNLEGIPSTPRGFGAKLKRSTAGQCNSLKVFESFSRKTSGWIDASTPKQPIDSSAPMSKIGEEEKHGIIKRISVEMGAVDYLHPMQSIFLGSDRRYNRYWMFLGPCDEFDPGHKRIYFESSEDGQWRIIDTREALCALISALDNRGAREAHLLVSLQGAKEILMEKMSTMPNDVGTKQLVHSDESEVNISGEKSSSTVSDEYNLSSSSDTHNEGSSFLAVGVGETPLRGQHQVHKAVDSKAFDACIWKSFYHDLATVKKAKSCLDLLRRCYQCHDLYWGDEKHCRICHKTFELDFGIEERYAIHSAVCQANFDGKSCRMQKSAQLQALKAAICAIESAMPENAFLNSWRRYAQKLWVNRLRRTSNLKEFLQVLADFVASLNAELFNSNNLGSCCDFEELISNFSTFPHTYSAVALWLVRMDSLATSLGDGTVFNM